jgi:hypothetical protein
VWELVGDLPRQHFIDVVNGLLVDVRDDSAQKGFGVDCVEFRSVI